jgi:hypothetical protein
MRVSNLLLAALLLCVVEAHARPSKAKISEAECASHGGAWLNIPNTPQSPFCDLPTRDGAAACSSSDQCEGYCMARDPISITSEVRITSGVCSSRREIFGCVTFVEDGYAEYVCFD